MHFSLTDILKAIGPASSIIFAAWIFMGFLQQRYDPALDKYRAMIGQYRAGKISNERRGNLKDQVLIYRRRCELMAYANVTGIISAIFLILTLVFGELDIIFHRFTVLKYMGASFALIGFCLVITAAIFVIRESSLTHRQLDSELLDLPELAESTGQQSGDITTQYGRQDGLWSGLLPGWCRRKRRG